MARSWLLGWPHHQALCQPLLLLGVQLIRKTEVKTSPLLMREGPPPLPQVSEDTGSESGSNSESCVRVDGGVGRQIEAGGKTGWGTGLLWEIGPGRGLEGQMAGARRSPARLTRRGHSRDHQRRAGELGSCPSSASNLLCDLRKVTRPL